MLSLFPKVVALGASGWDAAIQIISAYEVNHQWQSIAGHAWNVITISQDQQKLYFLVDPLNRFVVNLEPEKPLTELPFIAFDSSGVKTTCSLVQGSFAYGITVLTGEKMGFFPGFATLYDENNKDNLELAVNKFVKAHAKHPSDESEFKIRRNAPRLKKAKISK